MENYPPQKRPTNPFVKNPNDKPYVVYGLIGVLAVIHMYVMTLNVIELNEFYAKYSNASLLVAEGEYYRLFTSMFLHGGISHLGFNCFALYIFGGEIEKYFGPARLLVIYLLGGLMGSLASFLFTQGNSIGASGAVFAVFGALVAYYYRNFKLFRLIFGDAIRQRLRSLGTVAALNLAIGFIVNASNAGVKIDNAAHIGGALGGLMVAWFITPYYRLQTEVDDLGFPRRRLEDITPARLWWTVSILFSLGLAASIFVAVNA
ncbi:MAG: rhomboid family intramembrane serine protease [Anaerolineae bacterium]|nr:rhomboid family intramembrane serine protease [Anaerolineae bacterium]